MMETEMKYRNSLLALLMFAVLAGIELGSATPPPINQNIGLYDRSIDLLITNATDQSACRPCHQTSETRYNNPIGGVPTRHHNLLSDGKINPYTGVKFGCKDCHPSTANNINNIIIYRSCIDCHNGTTFWAIGANVGNFSRPHHIGQPAQDRKCNVCHGSFVDNYDDGHYKPSYDTMFNVTPYATFKVTNFSQPDGLGGYKTLGGCLSCHLPNPNAKIGSNRDNHHKSILGFAEFGGQTQFQNTTTPFINVNNVCSVCHVIDYSNSTGYPMIIPNLTNQVTGEILTNLMEIRNSTIERADAAIGAFEANNITINGTGCEKCHGIGSLHNIQFNYFGTNNLPGYGHIGDITDCSGCHSASLSASTLPGDIIPNVDNVNPSVIIEGTTTTLTIKGSNFGNELDTYVVNIDEVTYKPKSITNTQIVVDISALTKGIHRLQLVHYGKFSKLVTLTVIPNIYVKSATLRGGVITITGKGFGILPPVNARYYISVNHGGKQIVSTSINSWIDSQIKAKNSAATIGDIVTVMTGNSGEAIAIITR
jgi:cytochrome c553